MTGVTITNEQPKRIFPFNIRITKELIVAVLFSAFLFISFFESYIVGLIGPFSRYFLSIIMILIVLTLSNIKFQWYHFLYIFWFIYKIVSVLWTYNTHVFELHIASHIGMTGMFLLITAIKLSRRTIHYFTSVIWFSSLIMGFLFLFFSRPYLGTLTARKVIHLFGTETDPNNLAAFLVIGIIVSIYYLLSKKNILLSILTIGLNLYATLSTGSRGALLALAVSIALIIIFKFADKTLKLKHLVPILILGAIAGVFILRYLPASIFERLFDFDTYEDGSGRIEIWKNALSVLENKYFFGAGWGANYGYGGFYKAVHNTIISMLVDVGILGVLAFFIPIISGGLTLLKKKESLPAVLLFSVLFISLFLDTINKRFFWVPLMMFFLYLNVNTNVETQT